MINKLKFITSKSTFVNYAFTIGMIIFAFHAPASFFDENGKIEFLEIFALSIGTIFCFIEYSKKNNFSNFFLTCGLILTLFIGRELSWGRVFFTTESGNIVRSSEWALRIPVKTLLVLYIIGTVFHAYKTMFLKNAIILLKKAPIMVYDLFLIAILAILSTMFESYYQLFLPKHIHTFHVALEESAEVAMYFAVSIVIFTYSNRKLLKHIKPASKNIKISSLIKLKT